MVEYSEAWERTKKTLGWHFVGDVKCVYEFFRNESGRLEVEQVPEEHETWFQEMEEKYGKKD